MKHHSPKFYRNQVIASGLAGILLIVAQLRILIIPLFVIQRYLVLVHEPKAMDIQFLNRTTLNTDISNKTLKRRQWLALINKQLLFPALITLYLVLLLIDQTKLRNLQIQTRYIALDQSFILFLVIISGLGTIYEKDVLQSYCEPVSSLRYHRAYITLTAALSLLGAYIIHTQVVELGIIWHLIATIAGVLIFLVGIMLLEDEEAKEGTEN